jgi:fluoride exporter
VVHLATGASSLSTLPLVMAGGALGSLARYGLVELLPLQAPWSLWVVNGISCLTLGFVLPWLCPPATIVPSANNTMGLYPLVVTGFLGGLSTFSGLIGDTVTLWEQNKLLLLVINLAGQILIGILLVLIGHWLNQALSSKGF